MYAIINVQTLIRGDSNMGSLDPNICSHCNSITFTNPEIILENSDYGRAFELDWKTAIPTLTYRRAFEPLSISVCKRATGYRVA